MKIDIEDYALRIPKPERRYWGALHWFWAKLFGERVPTSADRAHIGNLVLKADPNFDPDGFGTKWITDANRVYRIGDLLIFDYGTAPFHVYENPFKTGSKDLASGNERLLKHNRYAYPIKEEML